MVLNIDRFSGPSSGPSHPSARPSSLHAQLLPPRRPALRWLAGAALTILASAAAITAQRCADRELRDLPADERRVLFDRSFEHLLVTCSDASRAPAYALDERCRGEAAYLQRFPECGLECRALTDPFTPSAIH